MKKSVKIAIIVALGVLTIFVLFGLDTLKIFDIVNCFNIDMKVAESNADFEKWVADGNDPRSYDPLKFAHAVDLIEMQEKCIIKESRRIR